jgi:hypothetical protein
MAQLSRDHKGTGRLLFIENLIGTVSYLVARILVMLIGLRC